MPEAELFSQLTCAQTTRGRERGQSSWEGSQAKNDNKGYLRSLRTQQDIEWEHIELFGLEIFRWPNGNNTPLQDAFWVVTIT